MKILDQKCGSSAPYNPLQYQDSTTTSTSLSKTSSYLNDYIH